MFGDRLRLKRRRAMAYKIRKEETYHIKHGGEIVHVVDRELYHDEECPAPPQRVIFMEPCDCIKPQPLPPKVEKIVRKWGKGEKETQIYWDDRLQKWKW